MGVLTKVSPALVMKTTFIQKCGWNLTFKQRYGCFLPGKLEYVLRRGSKECQLLVNQRPARFNKHKQEVRFSVANLENAKIILLLWN